MSNFPASENVLDSPDSESLCILEGLEGFFVSNFPASEIERFNVLDSLDSESLCIFTKGLEGFTVSNFPASKSFERFIPASGNVSDESESGS